MLLKLSSYQCKLNCYKFRELNVIHKDLPERKFLKNTHKRKSKWFTIIKGGWGRRRNQYVMEEMSNKKGIKFHNNTEAKWWQKSFLISHFCCCSVANSSDSETPWTIACQALLITLNLIGLNFPIKARDWQD